MKKIYKLYYLFIFCMIFATSCSVDNIVQSSDGETLARTAETSLSESDTLATTSYTIGYEFDTNNFDMTFEDVCNVCEDMTGVDLEEYVRSNCRYIDQDNYHVVYIDNYQAYLNSITTPDPVSGEIWYSPEEYEYHIIQRLIINDVTIDEFDDEYWAEINYSKIIDMAFEHNCFIDEELYPEGYCFMYDDSESYCTFFYADYITGQCIINYYYSYNEADNTRYRVYLDLCERLNLPTCPEITEEIMGS